MTINTKDRSRVMSEFQQSPNDTASPEVQVALISGRISHLTEHFKVHAKDNHSRLGLLALVNKRRRLLDYLKSKSNERYQSLIARLGLRK